MTRLLRRRRAERPSLGALKLRAIDVALERFACRTLADLGGVWAVDGGYTFHALERHRINRAVIADTDFTDPVRARAARDDGVELIEGNFGTEEVASQVGSVDALIMFDVLLHQVAPDWDEVLDLYARRTECLILAGPWWNGAETIRLLDLGREAYLENVPLRDMHASILERLDEWNDKRGRLWRDAHDIWQWGITDADLRRWLDALGFTLAYHENLGRWGGLERFDNCCYVFVRRTRLAAQPSPSLR